MSMCQPPLSPELLSMLTDDPRRELRKLPSTTPLLDRVLLRCIIDANGCWFFTGAPMADGYASVGMKKKAYRGHHVTFDALVGERQAKLWTDHTCRVRRCCNPWHLEEVPPGENTLRGYWANGHPRRTHCQAGHAYAEVGWYTAGKTVKKCAACMRGWMDTQNARRRAARRA